MLMTEPVIKLLSGDAKKTYTNTELALARRDLEGTYVRRRQLGRHTRSSPQGKLSDLPVVHLFRGARCGLERREHGSGGDGVNSNTWNRSQRACSTGNWEGRGRTPGCELETHCSTTMKENSTAAKRRGQLCPECARMVSGLYKSVSWS